uniref:CDC20/Fizzy WD40 domain-containing protein n=1 Tax=Spongospora subterranea TaxID=70186 RepID=A0A0H5RNZ6_9EUKA|eukprot:CRZ10434.1 hypothetical protein [Spongospora subterranea]
MEKQLSSSNTPGRKARTPFKSKPTGNTPFADRFIPVRSNLDQDLQVHALQQTARVSKENWQPLPDGESVSVERFQNHLTGSLFPDTCSNGNDPSKFGMRILSFRQKAPQPPLEHQNNLRVLYTQNRLMMPGSGIPQVRRHRFVSSSAERVLDAPDLLDDYYVNLLEWSSKDFLAVGLGQSLYLWDAKSGNIELLMETVENEDYITSVSWMSSGTHLAIGTTSKQVQLWDVQNKKKVRVMKGHQGRVCSLAWNKHILSSGSRDSNIFNHDVRVSEHHISTFSGHSLEVCGLAWSPDGTQLASGGNDNLCNIWEINQASQPRHVFTDHTAAVKALAWSPHSRHLLSTGGGTSDRHIRFWNTTTGACLNHIDTNSQVCGLVWNPHENEILSAHGFSKNQLTLWKYPSLGRVTDLIGHTSRVLHLALSSDGTTVCSAAADETLRFWKVFEPVKPNVKGLSAKRSDQKPERKLNSMSIR